MAEKYSSRLNVAQLDITQYPEVTAQFGIKTLPALLLFKEGQVVEFMVGAVSADTIREKVEKVIWE
jgi:thioredoxin 1